MGCVIGKNFTVENNVDAVDGLRLPAPPIRGRPVKQISHSLSLVEVPAAENGDDAHSTLELEKRQHGGESYSHSYSVGFPSIDIRRRRSKLDPHTATTQKKGWPAWLSAVAGEAINNFTPRSANTFEKIDKIGQGTYSNVYRARDLITGKVVALKKVRFDNLEPENVKFTAREILVLHRLRGHPNVIKLEGLVTSRLSTSLYLVFEYMDHDLSGLLAASSGKEGTKFTESQVKCYMKQLLSGLEHCHKNGVLHRDIKGSNLLINENGILKLADFGLATFYNPDSKKQPPLTSRVVTLWYRPPELLLGATSYGVGVDLWSAGCILAELLTGKPILPGRTEVEQLHRIFKLCGSPSEGFWKSHHKLTSTTHFKPHQPYKRRVSEVFKDFPLSSVSLLESLLSIDPGGRGTATAALNSEFFLSEPYASEPSSLPKYPPSKEMDLKLKNEAAARKRRGQTPKSNPTGGATRVRDRASSRPLLAPHANAEIHTNPDRLRVDTTHGNNRKSKREKFPPPHQDGAVGIPLPVDTSSSSTSKPSNDDRFDKSCSDSKLWNWKSTRGGGGLQNHHHGPSSGITGEKKPHQTMNMAAPSRGLVNLFRPLFLRAAVNGYDAPREDEKDSSSSHNHK